MTANSGKPRIVIYGMGQFGSLITRLAVAKGWSIAAAYNRAGPKIGQDLGQVAGLDRELGIAVQDFDTADFAGLEADIAVVTHRDLLKDNMPAYRRLIGAGLNVVCHGVQSYYPQCHDPVLAAEIEGMAREHGVTFTGSGIWDMSRIWSGILAAGPCTDITSIDITSLSDAEAQTHSLEQMKQFAISEPIKRFYEKGIDKSVLAHAFKSVPEMVLVALGYDVIKTTSVVEPVVFDEAVPSRHAPDGQFPAGLCMGIRMRSKTTTRQGVTGTAMVDSRIIKPGEIEAMYWSVEGKPRTRIHVERLDSAHATASNLFNRIPDVIAARPGIVPVFELGPVKHSALS
ncbi:MAG: 4-hydroxy-tetrahydrodipicolinate reductase [Novosphingobium sp.]|nr:4-hydroxy-tetrahydrodipicolinate reductase [Novosphingobium sp.]